jgi:hypothetical protein
MANNRKNTSQKPWKVKKKKKKSWANSVLCIAASLILITGVLIGLAFSKDPDKVEHKSEEALILEELLEIGEENLLPDIDAALTAACALCEASESEKE